MCERTLTNTEMRNSYGYLILQLETEGFCMIFFPKDKSLSTAEMMDNNLTPPGDYCFSIERFHRLEPDPFTIGCWILHCIKCSLLQSCYLHKLHWHSETVALKFRLKQFPAIISPSNFTARTVLYSSLPSCSPTKRGAKLMSV